MVKSRAKKDYTAPQDPNWNDQWSLVRDINASDGLELKGPLISKLQTSPLH